MSPADEDKTQNGGEADEYLGHFSRVVYSFVAQGVEVDLVLGFRNEKLTSMVARTKPIIAKRSAMRS